MTARTLAIDPGASGGLAWTDRDGITRAEKMPEGMTAICDRIRAIAAQDAPQAAIIEKVGGYMPGNSGPAAATFARHCGVLEAACYMAGLATVQVTPGKWMKAVFGALPKEKRDRKHAIQDAMQRRFPHLRVTLAVADALGLLVYATEARL